MTLSALWSSVRNRSTRVVLIAAVTGAFCAAFEASAIDLDAGFGAGRGYVPISAPETLADTAAAVVAQADGKFIVLGGRLIGARGVLLLQRYAVDGTLDLTFGDQGIATIDALGLSLSARNLFLQQDGRIVVTAESAAAVHAFTFLATGQI